METEHRYSTITFYFNSSNEKKNLYYYKKVEFLWLTTLGIRKCMLVPSLVSMVVGLRWTVVNVTPFITNEDPYFPIKQRPLQIKK